MLHVTNLWRWRFCRRRFLQGRVSGYINQAFILFGTGWRGSVGAVNRPDQWQRSRFQRISGIGCRGSRNTNGHRRHQNNHHRPRRLIRAPNLPIGPYTLDITKDGFAKFVQNGIVLQVDSNPTIDASLKVGAVNDAVTVEADAGMVETHSTGIGTVIDNARVVELPLNGRDATQLIFLSGMATPGTVPQLRNFPATSVSVAGGQGNGVSYQLDGSQMNDVASSLNLPLPFPDALQEFKVETSALPPQYGFHSAATVNAVTKAGTNGFHGDLFDFIRNGDFNARNYFALTRDSLKQNQWGGTIGGPVLKNKLFFFAGWQQRETRSNPPSTIAFVPTAAELQGDFSAVESPACNNGVQKTLKSIAGVPVTGNNQIPASLIAPTR